MPADPFDHRVATEPVEGTRLESVEEIRQALKQKKGPAPTVRETPAEAEVMPYRPVRRPPMALLGILDDGKEEGEWVRLRGDRVLIGRVEGDVVIPHDTMMSGRHAELVRRNDGGRFRWHLTDLGSTNGTFVRVGNAVLRHNQEILLGSRCYRFDAAPQGADRLADTTDQEAGPAPGTRGWQGVSAADLIPSLVELTPKGEGQRFPLTRPENFVGRNPTTCAVVLTNDPFVSPQHPPVYQDAKGRWHVENARSLNGLWLRVEQAPLDTACQFQLGEQRFLLRVL